MPGQYRAMILLASWCALRFGELTELRRVEGASNGQRDTPAPRPATSESASALPDWPAPT